LACPPTLTRVRDEHYGKRHPSHRSNPLRRPFRLLGTGPYREPRPVCDNGPRPAPGALRGRLAGAWLVLADLLMVLGIWADIAALMMAAFLIPTALLFHRFWTIADPAQRRTQEGAFYRNVSLLGATLALFALFSVVGAVRFAITGPFVNLH